MWNSPLIPGRCFWSDAIRAAETHLLVSKFICDSSVGKTHQRCRTNVSEQTLPGWVKSIINVRLAENHALVTIFKRMTHTTGLYKNWPHWPNDTGLTKLAKMPWARGEYTCSINMCNSWLHRSMLTQNGNALCNKINLLPIDGQNAVGSQSAY